MSKLILSTFGMNAGLNNDNDILLHNLDKYADAFDKIWVYDGEVTKDSKEFYSKLPGNIEYWDKPWDNNYKDRYEYSSRRAHDGDHILQLDSDETPSPELVQFLDHEFYNLKDKYQMFRLPCILHIKDGDKFYPVELTPDNHYHGQWTKDILYRKNKNLDFRAEGSHVWPYHHYLDNRLYIPHPYYHFKTLEGFIFNDAWQAFSSPEGQRYTQDESYLFRSFVAQFKTIQDFKKATQEGAWPIQLQKFAYTKRKEFNRPISRLSWVYYILYNNKCPFGQFDLTWEEVRQHVLSPECMKLLDENIKNNNYFKL